MVCQDICNGDGKDREMSKIVSYEGHKEIVCDIPFHFNKKEIINHRYN